MPYRPLHHADHDLEALSTSAQRRRTRFITRHVAMRTISEGQANLSTWLRGLPARLWLHLVIVALVPLTALGSHGLASRPAVQARVVEPQRERELTESLMPIAPISLSLAPAAIDSPVADAAFAEIAALAEVGSTLNNSERAAALTFSTNVIGDRVNLRNGPGPAYDVIGTLTPDVPLVLQATAGEWFAGRTPEGSPVWISAELVADAERARSILPPALCARLTLDKLPPGNPLH